MNFPKSWLHEYLDVDISVEDLSTALTEAGFEVEGLSQPFGEIRGVIIVRITHIDRVEGSDKLSYVTVTDGTNEHHIVCGASNYVVGDLVPACLPGATLPGGITIEAKALMGVTSHGMLASARELGIGDDHEGIWILSPEAPLGVELADWLHLDDWVYEIDVTPDSGYGSSMWGLAKDLHAMLDVPLTLPTIEPLAPVGQTGIEVTLDPSGECRRWMGIAMDGIAMRPSPEHVQVRLAMCGMRPINAVVDASNYALLETGHPTHTFDRDQIAGAHLTVRGATPSEPLTTLDGVQRTLVADDVVIADANGPASLAGVMGGESTEVTKATTKAYIEVATWSPQKVIRTARRHQLFSVARERYERNVPADSMPLAATRVAQYIAAWTGAQITGVEDQYPIPDERPTIRARHERIRSLIGEPIANDEQERMLTLLGCTITHDEDGHMLVVPPVHRPDMTIEADVTEEVARVFGYNNIRPRVPSTGQSGRRGPQDMAIYQVRRALAGSGWTEVLSYPFTNHKALTNLLLDADDPRLRTIALVNPLSQEEAVLRTTLLPGILEIVKRNVNRQNTNVAVFEYGHVFVPPTEEDPAWPGGPKNVNLPAEPTMIALAGCGEFVHANYAEEGRPVDVRDLTGAIALMQKMIGLPEGAPAWEIERYTSMPFHPGRAGEVCANGVSLGVFGELHPRVAETFGVPPRTVVAELRLDRMVAAGLILPQAFVPSGLPSLRFDIAVVVDSTIPHASVLEGIKEAVGPSLTSVTLFDVYAGSSIGEGKTSLAFALVLDDPHTQLTDVQENEAIERIVAKMATMGAHVRGRE